MTLRMKAARAYVERHAAVTSAVLAALAASPSAANAQERLEEIIVTSSVVQQPRRQIATAVSVIDSQELELRGYNDLADALRTQTGIGVSNSGGPGKATAVRIRGEDGFRTLLMIDGVKAVDPSGVPAAPSFESLLTTSDIQRIEVLRGPQGFMYGADAGGVVSVMTARGDGPLGGRVGLEHGALDTTKVDASVTGGGDAGDYFFSVTDFETDGFNSQMDDTALADDDGASNTTLHTKLGWNASDSVRLQLVARDIDASSFYDGCFDLASFTTAHDCRSTTEHTTYKASAEHRGENVSNLFGYSNLDIDRRDYALDAPSFASRGQMERLEYTGSFRAADSTTLAYGVDLQEENVTDATETRTRDQDGYYFEYQGEFADRFFLLLGARYDDNEDFGTHLSKRLSAAYVQGLSRGDSIKYRASFGTGFRAPSLFEVAYNRRPFGVHPDAAATPLTEEQSEGYDVGIDYFTANGVRLELTYFDHEITDQITYVSLPVTFEDGYLQTPGASRSTGIEIGIEARLGTRWAIVANWTNNDAKTAAGAARYRRPENLGNIGLRYVSPGEALRFIANYRISSDAIDFGDLPLDDYDVLDLSLSYALNETFELYGRIQNATDEEYSEIANYNTAGRALYAGARLKF